jgi:nitrate/TMAO reductase-like tetraheme cytochrome c subunit
MELIAILNRCHRFRGFVYQHAYFSADKKSIEVAVRPRKGSAAVCSRCHLPADFSTSGAAKPCVPASSP